MAGRQDAKSPNRQVARVAAGRPLLLGVLLLAACADPRDRPVPPELALAFDTAQVVRSPGIVVGTVNVHASGGMDFLHLRLATANESYVLDTLQGFAGEEDVGRAVAWQVTPGLAPGTTLHFVVLARDFVGFETTDSLRFVTQP